MTTEHRMYTIDHSTRPHALRKARLKWLIGAGTQESSSRAAQVGVLQ